MDITAIVASILAMFAPLLGGVAQGPMPAQISSVVDFDDFDDRWDNDDWDDDWDD